MHLCMQFIISIIHVLDDLHGKWYQPELVDLSPSIQEKRLILHRCVQKLISQVIQNSVNLAINNKHYKYETKILQS